MNTWQLVCKHSGAFSTWWIAHVLFWGKKKQKKKQRYVPRLHCMWLDYTESGEKVSSLRRSSCSLILHFWHQNLTFTVDDFRSIRASQLQPFNCSEVERCIPGVPNWNYQGAPQTSSQVSGASAPLLPPKHLKLLQSLFFLADRHLTALLFFWL